MGRRSDGISLTERCSMRRMAACFVAVPVVVMVLALPNLSRAASQKQQERLKNARDVLQAIMNTPDKGIPQDLFARAACVGIIPSVKKLAIGFGGEHGAGYVICRRNNGKGAWGAPSGFSISG